MSIQDYAETDMISKTDPSETELQQEIATLLASRTHRRVVAALPPEISRSELRAAVPLTQDELAQRLGLTQARVSRIECHPNPHVGLLSTYIDGLGGRLHLLARFEKGDFRILL